MEIASSLARTDVVVACLSQGVRVSRRTAVCFSAPRWTSVDAIVWIAVTRSRAKARVSHEVECSIVLVLFYSQRLSTFPSLGDSVVQRLSSLVDEASFADAMDQRRGSTRWTALMEAMSSNNLELVSFLARAGVNVHTTDKLGRTAFDIARAAGRPHLLALLGRSESDVVAPYDVMKVMLLGDSLAGKSSLTKALAHVGSSDGRAFRASGEFRSALKGTALDCRTIGVDISTVCLQSPGVLMNAIVYDTAGHSEFYNAHLPFISSVGVYCIVFSLEWDHDHVARYVELWSSSLPRDGGDLCVVCLIGTHRTGAVLTVAERQVLDVARRSFLACADGSPLAATAMYHAVDSLHGWGVVPLVDGVLHWKDQRAAAFSAPQRWVHTIDCVVTAKSLTTSSDDASARWLSPVLSFSDVKSLFGSIRYSSDEDVRRALAFLDSIGLIVYKGRTGDGSYGDSELDDIVLLRPQVVTDALQRLITPTVPSLTAAKAGLETKAAWCERCGGTPKTLFSRKLQLLQCRFCVRWFCRDHVKTHSVDGVAMSVCEVCTPLVTTGSTAVGDRDIDVSVLASTGRLSRTLLASLWRVYPSPLQMALEALLVKAKFLCRAPSSPSFVSRVRLDGSNAPVSSKSDDLFVPCIFVQCPSIAQGLDATAAAPHGTRCWWIDLSLWPAGMWSDVIGCLASVNARWEPERCDKIGSDDGTHAGR